MDTKKIPGIYNFCDRWCERCCFTSRCAIYESESDLSSEERDISNGAFWKTLAGNFEKAFELLHEAARAHGLDLDTLEPDTDYDRRKQQVRSASREHPLGRLSAQYGDMAAAWLNTQPGMVDRLEALREALDADSSSFASAKDITDNIRDCLAVIQWYKDFIHVKLVRALMGRMRETFGSTHVVDVLEQDGNGSVKVALLAIQRSMQAWVKLYELLPEREDDFLRILALLEKVGNMAREEFPNAEKFRRPGFDD